MAFSAEIKSVPMTSVCPIPVPWHLWALRCVLATHTVCSRGHCKLDALDCPRPGPILPVWCPPPVVRIDDCLFSGPSHGFLLYIPPMSDIVWPLSLPVRLPSLSMTPSGRISADALVRAGTLTHVQGLRPNTELPRCSRAWTRGRPSWTITALTPATIASDAGLPCLHHQ